MFLSDNDLTELTGYRRNADRRAWLARNRIPFFVAASGKPVVLRSDLEGYNVRSSGQETHPRLRLAAKTV